MGWIVLGILLAISSALNAYQVVAVDDPAIQLGRGVLSLALAALAWLSVRKGLTERSQDDEETPGAIAAAQTTRRGLIPVAAIAILILGVVVIRIAARGPSLSMPEVVAGHQRLHGPSVDEAEQGIEEALGSGSLVGIYGTGGQPRFTVLANDNVPLPGEDPLRQAVDGMAQAGVTIDAASRTTTEIGSVTYSCVEPASATDSPPVTLCDWNDGESYGLVLGYAPGLDASDLVPDVYEAVVE
jgi:hypothetical protein